MKTLKEETNRDEKLRQLYLELLQDDEAPLFKFREENEYLPILGKGSSVAKIMLIAEASGEAEAKIGKPFVGAAGRILDKILNKAGLNRSNVYITNIIKERPPANRDPIREEIDYYSIFLEKQIEIIQPTCIVTLGRFAMQYILNKAGLESQIKSIGELHGQTFNGKIMGMPISIVTLYHPAALLQNGALHSILLKDIEVLKQFL